MPIRTLMLLPCVFLLLSPASSRTDGHAEEHQPEGAPSLSVSYDEQHHNQRVYWPEKDIHRVGSFPFGISYAVAVDDDARDLTFLGSGGAVLIIDRSDPSAPVLVSDDVLTRGFVKGLDFNGMNQRLYAACEEGGLEIRDVVEPASPQLLSRTSVLYYGTGKPVSAVQADVDFAIVRTPSIVFSLDVSDPTEPNKVDGNGFMGVPPRDIHVSTDGYVHTTGDEKYARLIVQPDGHLEDRGSRDFWTGPWSVFGTFEVAYLWYNGYLYILDLYDTYFDPWSVTSVDSIGEIAVYGGFAFFTYVDGLHIYDVSDYSAPFHVSSISVPGYPEDLAVSEGHAWVVAGEEGLQIVDVENAGSPEIVDVSTPESPLEVGSYQLPDVTDVEEADNLLYVCSHNSRTGGLFVLDLADPTSPVQIGEYSKPGFAPYEIDVSGDFAYVSEGEDVHVFSVEDPENPLDLDEFRTVDTLPGVTAWNRYILVSVGGAGLVILENRF